MGDELMEWKLEADKTRSSSHPVLQPSQKRLADTTSRDSFQDSISVIVRELICSLADKPPFAVKGSYGIQRVPATKSTVEVSTQTESSFLSTSTLQHTLAPSTDNESDGALVIAADGVPIIYRKLPDEVEALRAELASAMAHIIQLESSVRSLQHGNLSLREMQEKLLEEREKLSVQLRHAQAQELTHQSIRERLTTDLDRACGEVAWLRDALGGFHNPNSRIYQSVKDAVMREQRGEPPISPAIPKRPLTVEGDVDADGQRASKRPRTASTNGGSISGPSNPRPSAPSGANRSLTLPLPLPSAGPISPTSPTGAMVGVPHAHIPTNTGHQQPLSAPPIQRGHSYQFYPPSHPPPHSHVSLPPEQPTQQQQQHHQRISGQIYMTENGKFFIVPDPGVVSPLSAPGYGTMNYPGEAVDSRSRSGSMSSQPSARVVHPLPQRPAHPSTQQRQQQPQIVPPQTQPMQSRRDAVAHHRHSLPSSSSLAVQGPPTPQQMQALHYAHIQAQALPREQGAQNLLHPHQNLQQVHGSTPSLAPPPPQHPTYSQYRTPLQQTNVAQGPTPGVHTASQGARPPPPPGFIYISPPHPPNSLQKDAMPPSIPPGADKHVMLPPRAHISHPNRQPFAGSQQQIPVPLDRQDPKAIQLFSVLFNIDAANKRIQCKTCGLVAELQPDTSGALQHVLDKHKDDFNRAHDAVYPKPDVELHEMLQHLA